ncbi:interleukin-like EMT inducer domain-containing protein [Maribacter confluentis]|uniref:Interleukin-like EMT inducer domain-containing protein n=1 Tax=Maribacter confluentis TaxID=1656093 RepID=A0ABT8RUY4_9FLAO|nr:interleukin-like EMT inducer domain-containing protein [Maribacter confluentis]MDO1514729.1 interleukin-like EMT inducer domain-containing protein [Maribacter confluentis]
MKKFSPTPIHFIRFTFVLQVVMLCAFFQGWANVIEPSQKEGISFATLELNSHSFNAKKRSSFNYLSQQEHLERGLTIIHFINADQLEYKTFDTYGSKDEAQEFITVLSTMIADEANMAILAHDSAAASLGDVTKALQDLGFVQLSNLKGRQAYIMHNFNATITEEIHDTSIVKTVEIPTSIGNQKEYFPKIKYEFEPNINRYIAHAGGEVNGVKSTNTKDALDQNYKRGFRLFELDIITTSDGHLVAAHDWNMWARFTDYTGSLPPTHEQFMQQKIYGDYTTMDMHGINAWFKSHPDAILVTDKVNDPIAFADAFIDKDRLIMELFSVMSVEKASEHGIQAMISQEPLLAIKGDKINFLKVNNVKYVGLSRRMIASQNKLLLKLREAGIKVYVYNVNFDPGKDEQYVQDNELGLVYGMYADKWISDMKIPK